MIKVSDYIAEFLADHGVREVFMVTGGGAMHLDDALGHSKRLRATYHHHEQACAMAAEAYSRIHNIPACVCATCGPGATNVMTGVLCAYMESLPMIVLTGQVRTQVTVRSTGLTLRTMGVQEYDVTKSAAPMTKYAVMVEKAEDIRYHLEKAMFLSMYGRRGPVWLDVPMDIQAARVEPQELKSFDPEAEGLKCVPSIPDETITKILEILLRAERPLIFGGFGIRASGAYDLFKELVTRLGIPVIDGMSSVDLMEEDHPLYAGRSGMTGSRAGNFALQNCDVLLSMGSRQSIHQTGFSFDTWAREAYTIINDIDINEIRKPNLHVDLPVCGDVRELITKLLDRTEGDGVFAVDEWIARIHEWRRKYPIVTESEKGPQPDGLANTYRFYDVLSDLMKEDDILCVSCGTSRVAGSQTFRIKKGQRFITNSSTASMGYGLPAVEGLARACEGKDITLVTGEGSFMMNMQEMQTIRTNNMPVRIFMVCNGGYHSIRQTQNAFFGKPLIGIGPESGDLSFPDTGKIADCFGFSYGECMSNETIAEDLARAMELPLPALIRVEVTTTQKTEPKAASRKLADGTMVSSPLEDMAPFLSREELRANMLIPLTPDEDTD